VGQAPSAAETKRIVIEEIRAKWGKFSEDDLSSLKNKNDLVTQRASKYRLEKSLAKRDVDALMNGRQFRSRGFVSPTAQRFFHRRPIRSRR
jgi:hypothetical protein